MRVSSAVLPVPRAPETRVVSSGALPCRSNAREKESMSGLLPAMYRGTSPKVGVNGFSVIAAAFPRFSSFPTFSVFPFFPNGVNAGKMLPLLSPLSPTLGNTSPLIALARVLRPSSFLKLDGYPLLSPAKSKCGILTSHQLQRQRRLSPGMMGSQCFQY
jgi:hypothetical protein